MRITSKGQVTIPLEFRERFGLLPSTEVDFRPGRDGVRIVRARGKGKSTRKPERGQLLVERLRGKGDIPLSTDQILALMRPR